MSTSSLVIYTVDSFTDRPYAGNPAGVCLVGDVKLSDEEQLLISREMNHSETAFISNRSDGDDTEFNLRWFTPTVEVNLCGIQSIDFQIEHSDLNDLRTWNIGCRSRTHQRRELQR